MSLKRFIQAGFRVIALCILGAAPLAQGLTVLDQATVTIELANEAAARDPEQVTLPYHWNRQHGGASGKGHFTIRFSTDPAGPPQAMFIRRIGDSFEFAINGEKLAMAGVHGDPHSNTSTRPRLFIIPQHLVRADNVVEITIGALSGRSAGIGLVYAGTEKEVRALYQESIRWRNTANLVILVISAILGGLALVLWLRLHESLYLFYALSELLWAVHLADSQFELSPLPLPWWDIINFSSYAMAPGLISKFSLTLIDSHSGWIKRVTDVQLWLSVPVISFALLASRPGLVSIWLGLTILMCATVAIMVMQRGFRSSSVEQRVLATAVAVTCAAAIRDMVVFRILPGYGGFLWVVLAWAAFGISMAWIITERLHKSTQSIAGMNRDLARRLAQREQELGAMFESQATQDRHQAVAEERQRIMRDMHDGLGSQLVSAVHLVKDPNVPRGMLAEQLQDALDNLKLTVDAMQDTDGDIAMLLGAIRYRLSPRLEAIGVGLSWEVLPLPVIENWTIQKSRHLQMILFEAISNVIAHSKATHAHLRARHNEGETSAEIVISLTDNGIGFRPDLVLSESGQGLSNMESRAASIGASIQILSSREGTQVHLTIPVQAASG